MEMSSNCSRNFRTRNCSLNATAAWKNVLNQSRTRLECLCLQNLNDTPVLRLRIGLSGLYPYQYVRLDILSCMSGRGSEQLKISSDSLRNMWRWIYFIPKTFERGAKILSFDTIFSTFASRDQKMLMLHDFSDATL